MARTVYVTGAQKDAARLIVDRSLARGKPVPEPIRKIADAALQSTNGTDPPRDR
jgi:hypothetical protein